MNKFEYLIALVGFGFACFMLGVETMKVHYHNIQSKKHK